MFEIEYLHSTHFIKRLDPRVRIVCYTALAFEITLFQSILVSIISLLTCICLIIVLRVNITEIFKRLLVLNIFVLFLWLVLPFTYPGEPIFGFYFIKITKEGLYYTLLITLKCNSAFLLLFILIGTISSPELAQALVSLKVPTKLIYLILFTWRYLSVMWLELSSLTRSLKARSFEPKNNYHTYKTLAYTVGMLMIRAYERSKRVAWAMEARGFDGSYRSLRTLALKKVDLLFLSFTLMGLTLFWYLDWIHRSSN